MVSTVICLGPHFHPPPASTSRSLHCTSATLLFFSSIEKYAYHASEHDHHHSRLMRRMRTSLLTTLAIYAADHEWSWLTMQLQWLDAYWAIPVLVMRLRTRNHAPSHHKPQPPLIRTVIAEDCWGLPSSSMLLTTADQEWGSWPKYNDYEMPAEMLSKLVRLMRQSEPKKSSF